MFYFNWYHSRSMRILQRYRFNKGYALKTVRLMLLCCCLVFSYSSYADYSEQARAEAHEVLELLKKLDGLDPHLVLAKYKAEYQNANSDQLKLDAIYKIVTIPYLLGERFYYEEFLRLTQQLKLKEYEAIAEMHLATFDLQNKPLELKKVLLSWQERQPSVLSHRLKAHYLWQFSLVEQSQVAVQKMKQHYLTMKDNSELYHERFLMLTAIVEIDNIVEQKSVLAKQLFSYALKYQYPVNREVYLYNQILRLVDNTEYQLAEKYADLYLAIATSLNNSYEQFFAYQLHGYVSIMQQQYAKGLVLLEKANQFTQGIEPEWLQQNKRFEARAMLYLSRLEEAKVIHQKDKALLKKSAEQDPSVLSFHHLNGSFIELLEGNTRKGMMMIENVFKETYAHILTVRNANISQIRELADKEINARIQAKRNFNYLVTALVILGVFFIGICLLLIRQVSLKKALVESRDNALQMSKTDGLTQLSNRLYFQEVIESEFNRLKRYQHSRASLLILDIDKFKAINDTYGHPAGDQVLIDVGKLLNKRKRNTDTVARFGGEEFVILLPETTVADACLLAEELRQAIAELTTEYQSQTINFTTSIGLAEYSEEFSSITQWLDRADKALYKAKNSGRNKVVSADF